MLLTLPIREVIPATPRSRVVRIELGDRLFDYRPGRGILTATHAFAGRRPYSLAGAPEDARRDRCLELLVGLNAEGAPGAHLSLEPGALLDVEGPFGRFTFPEQPDAARFLFIAGGTGVAPLRAMLRHALNVPHRSISFLYSARMMSDFAYETELRGLARDGRIEFRQTVTRDVAGDWSGSRGRIGPAELAPLVHDADTLCFICGPPALVHDMPRFLAELGVPPGRIRIEEWG